MSYAMCLDNSWDVMCEEEMYDVNGGGITTWAAEGIITGVIIAVGLGFSLAANKAKGTALAGATSSYLSKTAAKKLGKKMGLSAANTIVLASLIGYAIALIDPVGYLVHYIDGMDGHTDGWIGKKGWLSW